MKRSQEAFWWSLFSAGGVMAALFMPVFIVATGFLLPFVGDEGRPAPYAPLHRTLGFWPVRLVVFVVVFLSLFHCAHRIRHILMDLGLRPAAGVLAVACYGGAALATATAALLLIAL